MKFLLNNQMGKSVQKINILFYRYNFYDVRYDFFLWKNITLQYNFFLYCCFFNIGIVFLWTRVIDWKQRKIYNSTYLNQGGKRKKLDMKCLKIIYLFKTWNKKNKLNIISKSLKFNNKMYLQLIKY